MGENGPTNKYPDLLPAEVPLAFPIRPSPSLEAPLSFDILMEQEKNKEKG